MVRTEGAPKTYKTQALQEGASIDNGPSLQAYSSLKLRAKIFKKGRKVIWFCLRLPVNVLEYSCNEFDP